MDESIKISKNIIQILQENNLPLNDDIENIATSVMLSNLNTIHLLHAVETRAKNVSEMSEDFQQFFRITEFIDYISNAKLEKEKALKELKRAKNKAKREEKKRRKIIEENHKSFYTDEEAEKIADLIIDMVNRIELQDVNNDDKLKLIEAIHKCYTPLKDFFYSLGNRLRNADKERKYGLPRPFNLANYLNYVNKRNEIVTAKGDIDVLIGITAKFERENFLVDEFGTD